MTNEEKAIELCKQEEPWLTSFSIAMQMAAWKEQQMIEKFREFLKNYENSVIITDADWVIEDFKKFMPEHC